MGKGFLMVFVPPTNRNYLMFLPTAIKEVHRGWRLSDLGWRPEPGNSLRIAMDSGIDAACGVHQFALLRDKLWLGPRPPRVVGRARFEVSLGSRIDLGGVPIHAGQCFSVRAPHDLQRGVMRIPPNSRNIRM